MVHANRLHYDPKAKPARKPAKGGARSARDICVGVLNLVAILVGLAAALSYLINGNFTWNYAPPTLARLKAQYLQPSLTLTPAELALYNGTDPTLPIYLAVMGDVFDVTAGREYYGPGGGYSFFSGRDAGRAFVTGCFQTHLTPDLRGLTPDELKSVDEWRSFYENSDKYFRVGKVAHPPIDPSSPIPPPCDGNDEESAASKEAAAAPGAAKPVGN
ncbi:hypothetical protein H9P43_004921 [Blastocladiella emersonii ATCC 22665]|nr:hypothetical protein H9P43_004921 [Blastocladiella emersonii ATCC 22665]